LARCLLIGCGCRGQSLARELVRRGHAVRGTTREPSRTGAIEAAGAEPFLGDPDRVSTLARALDHVSVACVLLGSAGGSAQDVAALHGSRLQMLLQRTLDTTVHGVVYEAVGSVEAAILDRGAEIVREACVRSRIPYALLTADPGDHAVWVGAAAGAVDQLLGAT
jgi:uncharacterized protein YbjT (DUF2867 family)